MTTDVLRFIKPPFVTEGLRLRCGRPVEKLSVLTWEQRHSLHLPHDLKNFYYSYDGISCYLTNESSFEDIPSFSINPIAFLVKIGNGSLGGGGGGAIGSTSGMGPSLSATVAQQQTSYNLSILNTSSDDDDTEATSTMTVPRFGSNLKAFEVSKDRDGKYCLVYGSGQRFPTVWFLDRALVWHFVAYNFTCFFRKRLNSLYTSSSNTSSF